MNNERKHSKEYWVCTKYWNKSPKRSEIALRPMLKPSINRDQEYKSFMLNGAF